MIFYKKSFSLTYPRLHRCITRELLKISGPKTQYSAVSLRNVSYENKTLRVNAFLPIKNKHLYYHVSARDYVDEQKSYDQYEKACQTLPHFKPTIEGRSMQEDQEKKTGDILSVASDQNEDDYLLPHPIWSQDEVDSVKVTHKQPSSLSDKAAYFTVQVMRTGFDLLSGYTVGKHLQTLDERSVLIRCIFLETVAGVPGFAAAMIRHLHSLRRMERDHGWIHTLLEEAENERMHLMTFLQLRHPGPLFRYSVIITQWIFTGAFSLGYLISPRFCHRFVGYLEEQAVITYTCILNDLDEGRLPMWGKMPAPEIALRYWQLPDDAMMRDVILAIRADEAHHRVVNHTLGSLNFKDRNPFKEK